MDQERETECVSCLVLPFSSRSVVVNLIARVAVVLWN